MRLYAAFRETGPHTRAVWNELLSHMSDHPDLVRAAYKDMTAAKIAPNEASFATLLRAEASSGDTAAAVRVLDQMAASGVQPRLRSFAPLVSAAAETAPAVALRLWLRMAQEQVPPTDALTVALVKAVLSCDDDDALLWAAVDEVLSQDFGRSMAPAAAVELQRIITERPATPTKRLKGGGSFWSWFTSLAKAQPQPVCEPVTLRLDGRCSVCGGGARLVGLSSAERRQMRKQLMRSAASRRGAGGAGGEPHVRHDLAEFAVWLKTRVGPRFTVAIDGANVAYYGQNRDQGAFSFDQIAEVVRALKEEGHFPLIVLPRKYMAPMTIPNHIVKKFSAPTTIPSPAEGADAATGSNSRLLTAAEKAQRAAWSAEGILFAPAHYWTDDDIYWMYLTVVSDAGPNVAVVTNDLARDHRAWLLASSRSNFRWQTNHVRRFDFKDQRLDGFDSPLAVDISSLPLFSREVQREAREGFAHWHFPIEEDDAQAMPGLAANEQVPETRWLCLQLPVARQEPGALQKLIKRLEDKARAAN
jgi:hypothetical protein